LQHRGPLGVTLCFLVMGMMFLILTPPFVPKDESSHVAYALAVADGRLPRIDDVNPKDAIPGLLPYQTYVANHPPLFYALGAVPLKVGQKIGHPILGLKGMRFLNLAFGAVAVFAAGWIGALLLPRRPEAPTLAAAALGLAGLVPNNLAYAMNDGIALAASVGLLIVGLRILREGPSRNLLIALGLLAVVGGLSRITTFLPIGVAAVLAACGTFLNRPSSRRWLASIGVFLLPFVTALATSGWWYLRNKHLYGSATATEFILRMRHRERSLSPVHIVESLGFWRRLYVDIWVGYPHAGSLGRLPQWISEIAGAVGAFFLAVAGVRWWRRGHPPPTLVDAIAWTVLLAFGVANLVEIVQFFSVGGLAHARYLIAALPVAGCLAVIALRAVPYNDGNGVTIAVVGGSILLDLLLMHRFLGAVNHNADISILGVVAAVLLAGAFTIVAQELRRVAPAQSD
jgi:hypothetical protein